MPPRPGQESVLQNVLIQATKVSNPINRSFIKPLLIATRDYKKQKEAGSWQNRTLNVKDVFQVVDDVKGHVIPFDDIATSGATVMECAKVLIEAGAEKVTVLTLGSSQSKPERSAPDMIGCRLEGAMEL